MSHSPVIKLIGMLKRKEYKVFNENLYPFNLNIVGIRYLDTEVDTFGDDLVVFYKHPNRRWISKAYPITTRPGKHWLKFPLNSKGTAILAPGQYLGAYALGKYKFKTVLRQVGPVTVYRDNNEDSQFDHDSATLDTGLFGLHIHKAGKISQVVGLHSAGCQVFQKQSDFEEFIGTCINSAKYWGNSFTYTLLELEGHDVFKV